MADENNLELPANDAEKPVPTESTASETAPSVAISEISRKTINEHIATAPVGPKKRGPKPKLREYPAAGENATAANGASVDKNSSDKTLLQSQQAPAAPFDEKAAKAMVEGGLELMTGVAQTVIKMLAKKHKCTAEETAEALENVKPTEKARELITTGAVMTLKKRGAACDAAPEIVLGMGVCLWGGSVFLTAKAISEPEPKKLEEGK